MDRLDFVLVATGGLAFSLYAAWNRMREHAEVWRAAADGSGDY